MAQNMSNMQRQLGNMVAFIEQEAQEKCEEIDSMAEEEFNIKKGSILQKQRLKIKEYYDKKEKKIDSQKKLQIAKIVNQGRLKILNAQNDIILNLLSETRNRLIEMTENKTKYKEILKLLIIQGLVKLLEPIVVITTREIDQPLIKDCLEEMSNHYKAITQKEILLKLDTDSYLASESAGGIVLHTQNNRIILSNTLEERLELTIQKSIPEIKATLFGPNMNRKYLC